VDGDELATLRALTARLVPGPPEDPDPGALEAGAAEAIARLLAAFDEPEPPIHAARGGGFIPLDSVAELGWRMRIEGLASRICDGLASLDRQARERCGDAFARASASDQDAVLDEPELAEFVELVLMLTLDAVYGSPSYGGNRNEVGWRPLGWPGFTQPHGFTPEQVSQPDGGVMAPLDAELPGATGWDVRRD
jgi:gluconate 2-dehydrogenase gamma chain